jgi:hypothetical protein
MHKLCELAFGGDRLPSAGGESHSARCGTYPTHSLTVCCATVEIKSEASSSVAIVVDDVVANLRNNDLIDGRTKSMHRIQGDDGIDFVGASLCIVMCA